MPDQLYLDIRWEVPKFGPSVLEQLARRTLRTQEPGFRAMFAVPAEHLDPQPSSYAAVKSRGDR